MCLTMNIDKGAFYSEVQDYFALNPQAHLFNKKKIEGKSTIIFVTFIPV